MKRLVLLGDRANHEYARELGDLGRFSADKFPRIFSEARPVEKMEIFSG